MKSSRIQSLRVSTFSRSGSWVGRCIARSFTFGGGREDSYDRWKGGYYQRGLTRSPLFWEWFTKTWGKKTRPSFTFTQSSTQNAGILKLWLREYEHRAFLALFWKNYMTTWMIIGLIHPRHDTSSRASFDWDTWQRSFSQLWARSSLLRPSSSNLTWPLKTSHFAPKTAGLLTSNYISSNLQCWRDCRVASQYGQVLQGC